MQKDRQGKLQESTIALLLANLNEHNMFLASVLDHKKLILYLCHRTKTNNIVYRDILENQYLCKTI